MVSPPALLFEEDASDEKGLFFTMLRPRNVTAVLVVDIDQLVAAHSGDFGRPGLQRDADRLAGEEGLQTGRNMAVVIVPATPDLEILLVIISALQGRKMAHFPRKN